METKDVVIPLTQKEIELSLKCEKFILSKKGTYSSNHCDTISTGYMAEFALVKYFKQNSVKFFYRYELSGRSQPHEFNVSIKNGSATLDVKSTKWAIATEMLVPTSQYLYHPANIYVGAIVDRNSFHVTLKGWASKLQVKTWQQTSNPKLSVASYGKVWDSIRPINTLIAIVDKNEVDIPW